MFKKTLICFLLAWPLSTKANIDEDKYIKLYRREFNKKTATNLYASPAENKNAQVYRSEIVDYLDDKDHKIPDLIVEKRWKEYLKQYPNQKEFEKKLANAYLNTDFVKHKFVQNQYLDDYFRINVKKKALEDLKDRSKLLQLAEDNQIMITEDQLNERLLQVIANQGGDAMFESFLITNNFNEEEIKFFIKTDLIKEALINKMLEQEIDLASENHFNNLDQGGRKPRYYFSQAYIPHSVLDARVKLKAAQKIFQENSSIHAFKEIDPNIRVLTMDVPVSLDTKLFSPEINAALKELSKDGSIISSQISKIIETKNGFHVLQINGVEVTESISFEEAKSNILEKLKEQRSKDLNSLYNFFILEDQG